MVSIESDKRKCTILWVGREVFVGYSYNHISHFGKGKSAGTCRPGLYCPLGPTSANHASPIHGISPRRKEHGVSKYPGKHRAGDWIAESHLILAISKKMMESCISPCCCVSATCHVLNQGCESRINLHISHILPSLAAPFKLWLSDTESAVGLPSCSIWDALTALIT